ADQAPLALGQSMTARTGPLSDVRVLDLTQALAGPYCTMLLADLGADVIKVEPPAGDMSRSLGPHPADRKGCDYGGYFASVNRNKRSIVLDIKSDADRETFFKLAKTADAVVENAKTGVMDRAGISYERLREINPALVYAAIRGFGDPRTGASPYGNGRPSTSSRRAWAGWLPSRVRETAAVTKPAPRSATSTPARSPRSE